ncbi:hypothetical protein [Rhodovibrio salinarum]|uniref:Uncharacterized protein n=1 Tax=Rhodovibrio salinarum TaxID=1087 RepID=A0A934V143_9PROT|nr:hypothetical protein [Rhodovibrio salinarum]MBK1699042.1 hypothetical protein [Rhodovibrio salinarum]
MIERIVLTVIYAALLAMALAVPLEFAMASAGMGLFIAAMTLLIATLLAAPFIDLALSAFTGNQRPDAPRRAGTPRVRPA